MLDSPSTLGTPVSKGWGKVKFYKAGRTPSHWTFDEPGEVIMPTTTSRQIKKQHLGYPEASVWRAAGWHLTLLTSCGRHIVDGKQ